MNERHWTLMDEWINPGWIKRAFGPDLEPGEEELEVVPAFHLAEVEAENGRLRKENQRLHALELLRTRAEREAPASCLAGVEAERDEANRLLVAVETERYRLHEALERVRQALGTTSCDEGVA